MTYHKLGGIIISVSILALVVTALGLLWLSRQGHEPLVADEIAPVPPGSAPPGEDVPEASAPPEMAPVQPAPTAAL